MEQEHFFEAYWTLVQFNTTMPSTYMAL